LLNHRANFAKSLWQFCQIIVPILPNPFKYSNCWFTLWPNS
jgi:hypothetical protein